MFRPAPAAPDYCTAIARNDAYAVCWSVSSSLAFLASRCCKRATYDDLYVYCVRRRTASEYLKRAGEKIQPGDSVCSSNLEPGLTHGSLACPPRAQIVGPISVQPMNFISKKIASKQTKSPQNERRFLFGYHQIVCSGIFICPTAASLQPSRAKSRPLIR